MNLKNHPVSEEQSIRDTVKKQRKQNSKSVNVELIKEILK